MNFFPRGLLPSTSARTNTNRRARQWDFRCRKNGRNARWSAGQCLLIIGSARHRCEQVTVSVLRRRPAQKNLGPSGRDDRDHFERISRSAADKESPHALQYYRTHIKERRFLPNATDFRGVHRRGLVLEMGIESKAEFPLG